MLIVEKSNQNYEKYNNAFNELLELIEDIAPHIEENKYLKVCNNLKLLYDLKDKNLIVQNIHYHSRCLQREYLEEEKMIFRIINTWQFDVTIIIFATITIIVLTVSDINYLIRTYSN